MSPSIAGSKLKSTNNIDSSIDLKFVTTTNTLLVDRTTQKAIRQQASRYGYKRDGVSPPPIKPPTQRPAKSQMSRFRLGPKAPKKIPNQPKQATRKLSIHDYGSVAQISPHGRSREGEQVYDSLRETMGSNGVSVLYQPAAGLMDPFQTTSLPIRQREQTLLDYYFKNPQREISPLIPYCQVFLGLALQDAVVFNSVFSHYSAVYRLHYQTESTEESINHLTEAIRSINLRLGDEEESCSNGTIAAVAGLIIYESANGGLENIQYHVNGLEEMVNRRGGIEKADFPLDLKRLIAWTDINTANDLWQKPRFPSIYTTILDTSGSNPQNDTEINILLPKIQSLSVELSTPTKDLPTIILSDKIHSLERNLFDMIHTPPASHTHLDNAFTIAILMYMRSCMRDKICNFRAVTVEKLFDALMDVDEDFRSLYTGFKGMEKLVWTLGFGMVVSSGQVEGEWFVKTFGGLCGVLRLRSWGEVRLVLERVLWNGELDVIGLGIWEEIEGNTL